MRYLMLFSKSGKSRLLYIYWTSHLGLAALQVLRNHRWLVTAILDLAGTPLECDVNSKHMSRNDCTAHPASSVIFPP